MRLQHVHRLRQARCLHVEQQDFRRLPGLPKSLPHPANGEDCAAGVQGDGVSNEGIGAARLQIQRREDARGKSFRLSVTITEARVLSAAATT